MKPVYISAFYMHLILKHGVAVVASPSPVVGGWLVNKPIFINPQ